jgi:hypothetical protein
MKRRGLLGAALLLAGLALLLPSAAQAALAQPDESSAQPADGVAGAEAVAEQENPAPQPPLRQDCVPAARASSLIGQHGCVAGTVYRITHTHHGNIRLYLCRSHRHCSFHATVHAADRETVGDLWDLRGKVVAIAGDVTKFHGAPEIVVQDRGQIRVAADETPPEFDRAEPRPNGKYGRHRGW